jgi:hypothetical protein
MRTVILFVALFSFTFCSVPRANNDENNRVAITSIDQSKVFKNGVEAFPLVIAYDDTISISQPMNVTAILNSKMFKDIADHENLQLSYFILVNNKRSNDYINIEPSDTMHFHISFDSLEIYSDSVHFWYFLAGAEFKKDGQFFNDTVAIVEKSVFIKVD